MCPQLYMNYKLRSVAHLPWRMLTYKALNTFIDDLFASNTSQRTLIATRGVCIGWWLPLCSLFSIAHRVSRLRLSLHHFLFAVVLVS